MLSIWEKLANFEAYSALTNTVSVSETAELTELGFCGGEEEDDGKEEAGREEEDDEGEEGEEADCWLVDGVDTFCLLIVGVDVEVVGEFVDPSLA